MKLFAGKFTAFALSLAASLCAATSIAQADGALAVGVPNDDIRNGLAFGYALSHPNEGEAKFAALTTCLEQYVAGAEARASCRIVSTFRNKCVAFSWQNEGSGWGWAVESTLSQAENTAKSRCRSRASGSSACMVVKSGCDEGSAVISMAPSPNVQLSSGRPTQGVSAGQGRPNAVR